ncbi:protein disulfide-isomerase A4-like [Clytia hemisphaerica]|uniref:protein disulfide-isomerase A4-like n=1 Tax=Clytia hemisphaerica TaxID=252671 RepID=UPI0034D48264
MILMLCGHCKALAPAYAEAAKQLKKSENPVPLAKVDCTVEKDVCNTHQVQGYPTLKWFKDGEASDYDGPRDHDGIVSYVLERSDPNYKPPPEAVLTLTKDNFDEITQKEELMLVEFYAPWCGHCKKIGPELEKAAKVLQKREKPISIGKVDATVETDLATKFEVTGYPTMFIMRNGKKYEYKGPRNEPEISEYLINQEGEATKLKATMKEVKNFIKDPNNNDPVILAVADNAEDPIYKLFVEANNDVRDDYSFGHTFAKEAKKYFGLKKSAILLIQPDHLRSKHEAKQHVYQDESGSPSEVQEFYKKNYIPLVGFFRTDNENRFKKKPMVLVFYDVNFSPTYRSITQFWRSKVVEVAKEFPDVQFAVANEEDSEGRLKDLGLTESGEDVNVGAYDAAGRRYALVDEEFSEDTLTEFVEEFLKGNLKPVIKSQRAAPKAKPGKVQVVTGNTFDQIIMDESKEVFIEFYAPWCGHCKAIEGYINKLAAKYKGEKDIIIAKMDGTLNEGPSQYAFEGFPTIYYSLPGKKNEPIKLDGKRDMDALVKFIETNSKVLKNKKTEL